MTFVDREYQSDPSKAKLERQFINKPANQHYLEFLCKKHSWWDTNKGRPKKVDHWSEKNVPDRAKFADKAASVGAKYEEIYRMFYPQLSWNIHAGAVGLGSISATGIEAAFGLAHSLVQDLTYDATQAVALAFNLFEADPDLREKLRVSKEVVARSLMEASFQALEQQTTD